MMLDLPEIDLRHHVCVGLAAFALLSTGCPGDDSPSGETGNDSGTATTQADGPATSAVDSADADDSNDDANDDAPPPGCRDGGPFSTAYVVDDSQIRISTEDVGCTESNPAPDDCSWDHYDLMITIPSVAAGGSWTLPDPEISVVVTDHWTGTEDPDDGCVCGPVSTTPLELTTGMVTVSSTSADGYVAALELSGLDFLPLMGNQSQLVEACR